MAGSNILGRPLKANMAPPRPGDIWPPVNYVTGGAGGGGGGAKGSVKPLSAKPSDHCKLIFCGNLSYEIDDTIIADFFKDCGELAKIRWLTHVDSGDFKGCGYVEFWDTEAADKAVLLNGTPLLGRPIRIDWDSGGK
jgi:nucleolin